MHANASRAVTIHAVLLGAFFVAGCRGAGTEVVIEFLSPDRCVVFGEEMDADALAARLVKEQDRSPVIDTKNFRVLMARGMSEEEYRAAERRAQSAIRSFGAGNRVAVVRRSHMVTRIFTSVWFWVVVIVAAAGWYLGVKVKKARA